MCDKIQAESTEINSKDMYKTDWPFTFIRHITN